MQPRKPPLPPAGGPVTRRIKLAESTPSPEDRLSALPDALLGEIVSLLPTKDGARTQALASRWRHLWHSSPLNIDYRDLTGADKNDHRIVAKAISGILLAHQGPARRLCVKMYRLRSPPIQHDAWLDSPILNGLQEIEFWFMRYYYRPFGPLPPSIHRFSATLRVATFAGCFIPYDAAHALHFPNLKQLALEYVDISEPSLHGLIAGCPALEGLLIHSSFGFRRLRIDSLTLTTICVRIGQPITNYELQLEELVVDNAPCLQRLITLYLFRGLRMSVISAPKLHTLGFLTHMANRANHSTTLAFGSTVIQGVLPVGGLGTAMHTVKALALNKHDLTLKNVVDLMSFFPCLEKLHVKLWASGDQNRLGRKYGYRVRSLAPHLKTIAMDWYTGSSSHVKFARFFLRNARMLELMTFHIGAEVYSEEFLAEQHTNLQLNDKVSRHARLRFTTHRCLRDVWEAKHLCEIDLNDPFACRCQKLE